MVECLSGTCVNVFEKNTPNNLCKFEDKLKYQKFEKLLQVAEAFGAESKSMTPNL